jgi:ABC-type phosphate transport system permease subunit
VKAKKAITMLAAAGLAFAPMASANAASSLSVGRASASLTGASFFQDDDGDSNHGGGSTAVILGVLLVVLIAAAASAGGGSPHSP